MKKARRSADFVFRYDDTPNYRICIANTLRMALKLQISRVML